MLLWMIERIRCRYGLVWICVIAVNLSIGSYFCFSITFLPYSFKILKLISLIVGATGSPFDKKLVFGMLIGSLYAVLRSLTHLSIRWLPNSTAANSSCSKKSPAVPEEPVATESGYDFTLYYLVGIPITPLGNLTLSFSEAACSDNILVVAPRFWAIDPSDPDDLYYSKT